MNDRDSTAGLPADDWLEQALRSAAHEHSAGYIPDDGFTARVMDALPLPVTLPAWRRPALAALWGTAGLGGVSALAHRLPDFTQSLLHALATQPITLAQIGSAVLALAVASWAGALYALRRD